MKTKSRKTYGLNLETDLIERGAKKARAQRQSFSAYVCSLIHADTTCEDCANNAQEAVSMSRRPVRKVSTKGADTEAKA